MCADVPKVQEGHYEHINKVYTSADGNDQMDQLHKSGTNMLKSASKQGIHNELMVLNANHMAKTNLGVQMSNNGKVSISIDMPGSVSDSCTDSTSTVDLVLGKQTNGVIRLHELNLKKSAPPTLDKQVAITIHKVIAQSKVGEITEGVAGCNETLSEGADVSKGSDILIAIGMAKMV